MDYIILPMGKLIIDWDAKDQFKKELDDGSIVSLTQEEKEHIDSLLEYDHPEIMYNEHGVKNGLDIARENRSFHGKYDLIMPIIEQLEADIPENSKGNFYRNLATLKIDIPDYMEFEPEESDRASAGSYDGIKNEIKLNGRVLRSEYERYHGRKDAVEAYIFQVLEHEMRHMASSYYDKESGMLRMGFFELDTVNGMSRGRAFTEGYTALTTAGDEGYDLEKRIMAKISVLMNFMGKNMDELYYSAAGAGVLCQEFINGMEMLDGEGYHQSHKDGTHFVFGSRGFFNLLSAMDTQLSLSKKFGPDMVSSIPATIQSNLNKCLLDIYKKQLDLTKSAAERSEVAVKGNACTNLFKALLLTPDSSKEYSGLEESKEELEQVIDEMQKYYEFILGRGKYMDLSAAHINQQDYYKVIKGDEYIVNPREYERQATYFLDNTKVTLKDLRNIGTYPQELLAELEKGKLEKLLELSVDQRENREFMEPILYAMLDEFGTYEVYRYFGDKLKDYLKTDERLSREILLAEPELIKDSPIAENKKLILESKERVPEVIRYISSKLEKDTEFITGLCDTNDTKVMGELIDKYSAKTLMAIDESLKGNEKFMMAAISNDISVLNYADEKILNSYDFFKGASYNNHEVVEFTIKNNERIGIEAISGVKDTSEEHALENSMGVISKNIEKGEDERFGKVKTYIETYTERQGKANPAAIRQVAAMIAKSEEVDSKTVSCILEYTYLAKIKIERNMKKDGFQVTPDVFLELVPPQILSKLLEKTNIKEMPLDIQTKLEQYGEFYEETSEKLSEYKKKQIEQQKEERKKKEDKMLGSIRGYKDYDDYKAACERAATAWESRKKNKENEKDERTKSGAELEI